jgi:tetratricopeptide (TPR) repeat protein
MPMELREPPVRSTTSSVDWLSRWLLLLAVLLLLGLGWLSISGRGEPRAALQAEHVRQVAAKLQAAGALDEAALQYQRYLELGRPDREVSAGIAVSLGNNYLEQGRYESALRWYYEAETLSAGDLDDELAGKIVHTLERLGRTFSAQAALSSRAGLVGEAEVGRPTDDPVVARIGEDEIHRSEVERAMDDLPPELASQLASSEGRSRFLEQYVADELLWRKAVKLEYDKDPEVLRRNEALLKQLVVSRFAEQEVVRQLAVDEADLRNHFEAHKKRFTSPSQAGQEAPEPSFDEVRSLVERDYRLMKMQAAYQDLVDSELAAQGVELFPERMSREP